MEIAASEDFKDLRSIARAHLEKARSGDMAAIKELADRLDGKPAQDTTVNVSHTRSDQSDDELRAYILSAVLEKRADKNVH
jgi:ribosomal protein L18E